MTVFTYLALGLASLTATGLGHLEYVKSVWPVGSLLLPGHQYFLTDLTTTPKVFVDRNSVVEYNTPAAGDVKLSSGALAFDRYRSPTAKLKSGSGTFTGFRQSEPFTATGSRQTYTAVDITNPFTGTGILMRAHVETEKAPTAAKIVCHTHPPSSTNTGTVLRNMQYTSTQSGATLVHSTGSVIVPPNWGVRCWFATAPGAAVQGVLKLWLSEYFVP